jgi:hypothetical protein
MHKIIAGLIALINAVLKYIRAEQREWEGAVKAAGIKLD